MKQNNLFIKIANGSIGLQGIIPSNQSTSVIYYKQNLNIVNQETTNQTMQDYVFSNENLLKNLETKKITTLQKTNTILEKFITDKSIREENNKNLNEKILLAQNFSEKIANNKISSNELYSILGESTSLKKNDIEQILKGIQENKKYENDDFEKDIITLNEKAEYYNYSNFNYLNFSNIEDSKIINHFVSIDDFPPYTPNPFSKELNLKTAEIEKFDYQIRLQKKQTEIYMNKLKEFIKLSTALSIASLSLLAVSTITAYFSWGATIPTIAALGIQSAVSSTFVILSWSELSSLKLKLKDLNSIIDSKEYNNILKQKDIFIQKNYSKNIDFTSKNYKSFFTNSELQILSSVDTLTNSNTLLNTSSSEISETFFNSFFVDRIRNAYYSLYKKVTNFLTNTKIISLLLKSNILKNFVAKIVKPIQDYIVAIVNRIASQIAIKRSTLFATNWVNPISNVLFYIDTIISAAYLITLVALFKSEDFNKL